MDLDHYAGDDASPSERIDRICDHFEAGWLKGERPQMADLINSVTAEDHPALFYELMLVELEYRLKAGERPSRGDYLRDFPQFSDQVSAVYLEFGADAFATVAAKKDDTVHRGGYKPGDHVGHFELRDLLGSGAMGSVWKAWDPRLQRPVAIKIPRSENLTEDEKHRFLREGRSAAQLRHPNLAAVHEVDRDGDTPYIASVFVDGENLRDYCERSKLAITPATIDSMNRRLTFFAIADLCAEIAESVHHAHEQGVVHRDLKPANIIIDRANRPHVIDFGLAKWATDDRDLTLHGELLGTPAYMSPEQAAGKAARLDRRTDVYSLGVILYELLCGQVPFTGEMGSVIHRIISVEPVPVRKLNVKVPRDLETICIKALEKDPDRRYRTMQELAVDLRRFAQGEPILARRAGPLERGWRWGRRRPGMAAAILAIVLLAGTSSSAIHWLFGRIHTLQNFRTVWVTARKDARDIVGARVALVPIDKRTGEPDRNAPDISRGTTPFIVELKPGDYFAEICTQGDEGGNDIAEVCWRLPPPGPLSKHEAEMGRSTTGDDKAFNLKITLLHTRNVIAHMVAVPIDEDLRRDNPLLPEILYVDANETTPDDLTTGTESITFAEANSQVQTAGKRLPSAAEYDAIVECAKRRGLLKSDTNRANGIADLFSGLPEWTTTTSDYNSAGRESDIATLRSMHVLKGYGKSSQLHGLRTMPGGADGGVLAPPNAQSPLIGFRGVRSGSPRFINAQQK